MGKDLRNWSVNLNFCKKTCGLETCGIENNFEAHLIKRKVLSHFLSFLPTRTHDMKKSLHHLNLTSQRIYQLYICSLLLFVVVINFYTVCLCVGVCVCRITDKNIRYQDGFFYLFPT